MVKNWNAIHKHTQRKWKQLKYIYVSQQKDHVNINVKCHNGNKSEPKKKHFFRCYKERESNRHDTNSRSEWIIRRDKTWQDTHVFVLSLCHFLHRLFFLLITAWSVTFCVKWLALFVILWECVRCNLSGFNAILFYSQFIFFCLHIDCTRLRDKYGGGKWEREKKGNYKMRRHIATNKQKSSVKWR